MKGTSHALSGVAVGVWTLPFAPVHDPVTSTAWVAAVAGFALAPDLDAPGSTAARVWGPMSGAAARGLSKIAGGHRGATHDIVIAPAAVFAAAWVAALNPWAALAFLAMAAGLAQVALDPVLPGKQRHPFVNVAGCAIIVAAVAHHGADLTWLPFAAAAGVAVHIGGDALTTSGVPVPFTGWQDTPPTWGLRAFKTGTTPETFVCLFLAAAIAVYPFRHQLAPHLQGVFA